MRKLFLCSAVVLVAACGDGGGTSPDAVASLSVAVPVPSIPVGQTVTLTAQTVTGNGVASAAKDVAWSSLDPTVATVSATGVVTALAPGVATITATAASQTVRADVYVSSGSVSCAATAAGAPSVGEVRLLAGSERSELCLPALATGGEYVLVGFNASRDTSSRVVLSVGGERVVPVVGGPTPTLAPPAGELLASRATAPLHVDNGAPTVFGAAAVPDTRFHLALRGRERRELRDRMAGAARARAAARPTPSFSVAPAAGASTASGLTPSGTTASLVTVPPTKGAQVRLNTQSSSACSSPVYRGGRVVAVGKRAIIVADTANPAGGFSDADYAGFAAAFDTLVYPTDVSYFGKPSDVDDNDRSVIFFTRAVNELTPANSESYVGGFFFGRDLFPVAANRAENYAGCTGSNEAELFYMLVPDPNGVVNGNRRELAFVKSVTTGVLAHEFQHLINEGRRLYVNDANDFEEVWLNEGLSHVAEELMYYKVSELEPRSNIDGASVRSTPRRRDAFNNFQGSNFGRLRAYLLNPEGNSPYAADDSLATRGATWQFLRYAADRTTGDEAAVFKALVNSKTKGFANVDAVFGGSTLNLARDWAVAQYTDDAGIGQNLRTSYTFPSWNYRSVYAAFTDRNGNPLSFPLRVTPVPSTGSVQRTLVGGGTTYLRFASAPAATATVRVASSAGGPPESVQMVLIRTR